MRTNRILGALIGLYVFCVPGRAQNFQDVKEKFINAVVLDSTWSAYHPIFFYDHPAYLNAKGLLPDTYWVGLLLHSHPSIRSYAWLALSSRSKKERFLLISQFIADTASVQLASYKGGPMCCRLTVIAYALDRCKDFALSDYKQLNKTQSNAGVKAFDYSFVKFVKSSKVPSKVKDYPATPEEKVK
jgi:hypothetical protein